MKVKRIGTLRTFRQYEDALAEIIPKYLDKWGCYDGMGQILASIRTECHNPSVISCVVLDDSDKVVGFLVAYTLIHRMGMPFPF